MEKQFEDAVIIGVDIFLFDFFLLISLPQDHTSLEDLQDEEEEKSLAPTRCYKSIKATWSHVVAVCSF